MRNVLSELPVFLCCVWGGAAAGLAVFLLRLPRKLYLASRRGRRAAALPMLLFTAADLLAAAALAAALAATLLHANGGEPRLYALLGFAAGAASVCAAANAAAGGRV